MDNKLLSVQDIAKRLDIGKNVAYDLVKQPDFPAFKIGTRIKTTEKALDEWLEKKTQDKM